MYLNLYFCENKRNVIQHLSPGDVVRKLFCDQRNILALNCEKKNVYSERNHTKYEPLSSLGQMAVSLMLLVTRSHYTGVRSAQV